MTVVWIAVVLAGGRSSRLGGRHKPAIPVGAGRLLDRALAAVADATRIVVVGPQQPTIQPVHWTMEQPRGGGPVAGLAAGLAALSSASTTSPDEVVLLAGDLVGVTAGTVRRLRAALTGHDGAVLRDASGRRQWLISAWRFDAVGRALPTHPAGRSLRDVLGTGMDIVEVTERAGESADIDTPADLARFTNTPPESAVHSRRDGGGHQP